MPLSRAWLCALLVARGSSQLVYRNASFDVFNTTNVTYGLGLTCTDQYLNTTCTAMTLKLDVYQPSARSVPVPALKPALILVHGGGNSGGSRDETCLQGSAQFFVSRGFVAFNVDYRLAHDKGLLPAASTPPPPASGTALVSFLQRSGETFMPHPASQHANATPYVGPLQFASATGALCIAAVTATAGAPLTLETCAAGAPSQQWRLPSFSTARQHVYHAASGLCLDIKGADPSAPRAGLPIIITSCSYVAGSVQATWQLGTTGALITLDAALSVAAAQPHERSVRWAPDWNSGYPAVRDLKAAVRFVRAHSAFYGVDPTRIVVSGGSAGATNSLAAGVTFAQDYFGELTADDDFTLASTFPEQSSVVQAVYGHWSSDGENLLVQQHDPLNRSRYSTANAPVIEFHGNNDTTIPIEEAFAVQAQYKKTGVSYELHVLEGCPHSSWCYNGDGHCVDGCPNGGSGPDGYDSTMDTIALPFLVTALNLTLVSI